MFNSLTGIITAKFSQTVYLDCNGIEWDISVPDSSHDFLPPVGNKARIFTWLVHREDAMKLFGFATINERALFLDLLKVEGVGPKGALKILSSSSSISLTEILEAGDVAKLEKLPGVGKKTAQKMLLALKGKLTLFDESTGQLKNRRKENISEWNDVILALCDMGYDRHHVEQIIQKLEKEILSSDESKISKTNIEELLFRRSIVELSK